MFLMEAETILGYLSKYGLLCVFIVTLLEYLNLPGFPAGIIYPASGIYARLFSQNVILYIFVSVLAALIGSVLLYLVGYFAGERIIVFLENRFPKMGEKIRLYQNKMKDHETKVLFIAKFLPVIRTGISIPSGINRMNFYKHLIISFLAIFLYNGTFILAGFYFGNLFKIEGF